MALDIPEVLRSVPGEEQDFGTVDEATSELLEQIDAELMKRGTMSGGEIGWAELKACSLSVLASASHLLAFRGLIAALCKSETPGDFLSAVQAADTLFSAHFPKLHPKGKGQARRRKAWAQDILTTLSTCAQSLGSDAKAALAASPSLWRDMIANAKALDLETNRLASALDEAAESPKAKSAERPAGERSSHLGLADADLGGADVDALDAKGRAQLRRDIHALATRISTHDPDAAVAYHLRGYAAWLELQFVPETDSDGLTNVQSMPKSLTEEHRKNLSSPSRTALLKLEDRLLMTPDWFEGQRMSFQMAEALGLEKAARAIAQRCLERLEQWPDLRSVKYANGAKFVTEEVDKWLSRQLGLSGAPVQEASDEEWLNQPLEDVLSQTDIALRGAKSPREIALIRLRQARAFKRIGLTAQVEVILGDITRHLKATDTASWDAALLKEIEEELSA